MSIHCSTATEKPPASPAKSDDEAALDPLQIIATRSVGAANEREVSAGAQSSIATPTRAR